jgi:hypothetical protein
MLSKDSWQKKKSPLGNLSHAEAGHCREKQTSVFTLSDSFSTEAIQVNKFRVTLLSLLPNLQSHMRYISKGVAIVMCDLISSVPKDFFFYLQLEIGGVLG